MNKKTKITDKTTQFDRKVCFEFLKEGEWFLYTVGSHLFTYYKIENWISGESILNAVCIEENRVVSFKPNYQVIPLKNVEISFEREV